jgi:hypothetical protein
VARVFTGAIRVPFQISTAKEKDRGNQDGIILAETSKADTTNAGFKVTVMVAKEPVEVEYASSRRQLTARCFSR